MRQTKTAAAVTGTLILIALFLGGMAVCGRNIWTVSTGMLTAQREDESRTDQDGEDEEEPDLYEQAVSDSYRVLKDWNSYSEWEKAHYAQKSVLVIERDDLSPKELIRQIETYEGTEDEDDLDYEEEDYNEVPALFSNEIEEVILSSPDGAKRHYSLESEAQDLYRDYFHIEDDMCVKDGIFMGYRGENETIEIPEGVTEIAPYVMCCEVNDTFIGTVKKIVFPDSLERIGKNAFEFNANLTQVEFGKGLESIGEYAFYDCRMKEVLIPASVQSMGMCAFSWFDYPHIQRVTFEKAPDPDDLEDVFDLQRGGQSVYSFKEGIKKSFVDLSVSAETDYEKGKYTYEVEMEWVGVAQADGYKITYGIEKKHTVYVGASVTSYKVELKSDEDEMDVDLSVQPYRKVNGKKIYGKKISEIAETIDEEC